MLKLTAKTVVELSDLMDKLEGFLSATIKKEGGVWVAHVELEPKELTVLVISDDLENRALFKTRGAIRTVKHRACQWLEELHGGNLVEGFLVNKIVWRDDIGNEIEYRLMVVGEV